MNDSVASRSFPWVCAIWLCPILVFLLLPLVDPLLSGMQKTVLMNSAGLLLLGLGSVPYIRRRITLGEFALMGLIPALLLSVVIVKAFPSPVVPAEPEGTGVKVPPN